MREFKVIMSARYSVVAEDDKEAGEQAHRDMYNDMMSGHDFIDTIIEIKEDKHGKLTREVRR